MSLYWHPCATHAPQQGTAVDFSEPSPIYGDEAAISRERPPRPSASSPTTRRGASRLKPHCSTRRSMGRSRCPSGIACPHRGRSLARSSTPQRASAWASGSRRTVENLLPCTTRG